MAWKREPETPEGYDQPVRLPVGIYPGAHMYESHKLGTDVDSEGVIHIYYDCKKTVNHDMKAWVFEEKDRERLCDACVFRHMGFK